MKTNRPVFTIRTIMLVCLLLVLTLPQFAFAEAGTFQGMWPPLPNKWYFNTPSAVAIAKTSGNIYIADTGHQRIMKYDSTGAFVTSWGGYASGGGSIAYGPGFRNPSAIAIDSAENVYVTDFTMCNVQKFDKDGNFLTKWGQFGMDDPQFDMARPQGIAINSQGKVYVTQSGSASILVYDSQGNYVSTIDNGFGTANGQFRTPWAIAFDSSDNFYVTELDGNRVQKFAPDGTYITKWGFVSPAAILVDSANNVYVGAYFNNYISEFDSDGNLLNAWGLQSSRLDGFALDSADNFYVTDSLGSRIQKYAADGTLVATWEAKSSVAGKFAYPNAVAVDASGNIYVADTGNNRIQKFNASKAYVTSWGTYGTDDGQFDNPTGIAVDAAGNVYVVETGSAYNTHSRVQKFSPSGVYITQWDGSLGFQAFDHASGIAVSGNNVYVSDTQHSHIQQFDLTGNYINYAGWNGPGKSDLHLPAALATDKDGNVYVVDAGNSCVKKFWANLAQDYPAGWPDGGGGVLGSDGTADGQFRFPTGIVVDGVGNIYVADSQNRIQMFDEAGTFLKKWGTSGSDDGQFFGPAGMAIKTNGSIYVVDNDNSRIQFFTSTTVDVTPPVVTFTVPTSVSTLTITFTAFSATDDGVVAGYMVTDSAIAPLASSSDWLSEAPTTYTFNTSGSKILYGWAKDAAGNVSLGKKATTSCTADTTPPVVTVFTVPTVSKTLAVSPIVITATDASGATGYMITENNAPPQKNDSGWLATKPTSYTFADGTGDGTKTFYAWAKDAAGNVSAGKLATVIIATTAPVISDFTVPETAKTLAITGISITATGAGTLSYMITATATAPLATATTWKAVKPTSYTFVSGTTEGTKTLYAWAKDAAGNVSETKTATVAIDITKPVVTAFTVTSPINSLTVPVTALSATDNVAVTGYLITATSTVPLVTAADWSSDAPDSYIATAATVKMLYVWAKDAAGNVSLAKTAAVAIDIAAPTISVFTAPANTNKASIAVKITAADNVKATGYQVSESDQAPNTWLLTAPTTYTITAATEGSITVYAWVKDAAGNTASKSATVFYDKTAPTVDTFVISPTQVAATIQIDTFEASDTAGSGVGGYLITATATPPLATATTWKATAPTTFTNTVAGQKTIYAWVKDKAGNVSAAKTIDVTADVVLPVVTLFTLNATVVKEFKVSITALTATDLSGIGGYLVTETAAIPALSDAGWNTTAPADYTFTSAGAKKLYGWAKDAVGNISKAKIVSVTVDQTAPVVSTLTVPVAYNNKIMPITAFKGTDNVAVTGYLITESATAPDPAATTWTTAAPKSYTFSSVGKKTIYAWVKDGMGYVSDAKSADVQIDIIKPTVDSFTVGTPVKLIIPVTAFTGSDDTEGTSVAGYKITETATVPLATATGWTAVPPTSYTTKATATITKNLYAWVKDKAGNVSAVGAPVPVTVTP